MSKLDPLPLPWPRRIWTDRNVVAILVFEFLWGAAAAVSNLTTMVTGYIEWMRFPQAIVGFIPGLYWTGFTLLQPLTLYLLPHDRLLFRRVIFLYLIASLLFLLMGCMLAMPAIPAAGKLAILAGGLLAFSSLVGLTDPHYMAILFEAVPDHLRGRFFGVRVLCYGVGGWLGSFALDAVLQAGPPPQSFTRAFTTSGILYLAATAGFSFYLYRPGPSSHVPQNRPLIAQLRSLAFKVRMNRTLLAFLLMDALWLLAVSGGFPLYAGHVRRQLGADEALLARLTQANWLAICLLGPALGWYADRAGYPRAMFIVIALFILGSCLLLWPAASSSTYLAAYFLASVWLPGMFVVHFNLAQACARNCRPAETMAIVSASMLPIRLAGPLLIGAMVDRGHSTLAFGACGFLAAAASVLLLLRLPDSALGPRDADGE
ncbi:MAG: hypothetical protein HYU36_14970 [Planctomycetes bacterium]|nr:hypothetical protein [Planctomycetota bacterium]